MISALTNHGCARRSENPHRPAYPPTCLGPGEKLVLPLIADTFLDPLDEVPRGDSHVMRVSDQRTALLRFAAGANDLRDLSVTLLHANASRACGSGDTCTDCDPGTIGQLVMHRMRPDWDEAGATHVLRTPTEPWTTPGAAGSDRSAVSCTTAFDGLDASCKLTFALTDVSWEGDLSVQVRALGTATGVFGSREGIEGCETPVARAIGTCRRAASCGNGVINEGEGCDDGNLINGDGCSDGCTVDTALPTCGNGVTETNEECDDGNTSPADGCSANCTVEST